MFFEKSQKDNFIRWRKKIPPVVKRPTCYREMINDDTTSDITELSAEAEYKRKFEQVTAKLAIAEDLLAKKQTKRQKRLEKKTASVTIADLKIERHLPKKEQYTLRTHMKETLWRNVKFWDKSLEGLVVGGALNLIGAKEKIDRNRYRDYTRLYLKARLDMKRANAVQALKRVVRRKSK